MSVDRGSLERSVARLASERSTLFGRSGSSFGLSATDQNRLRVVERELDEWFCALREMRAVRDASRFSREDPVVRRAIARNDEMPTRSRRGS
jgi:hypothetical protein